jgi:hypothetical protein
MCLQNVRCNPVENGRSELVSGKACIFFQQQDIYLYLVLKELVYGVDGLSGVAISAFLSLCSLL